jgi:hypothetical protein
MVCGMDEAVGYRYRSVGRVGSRNVYSENKQVESDKRWKGKGDGGMRKWLVGRLSKPPYPTSLPVCKTGPLLQRVYLGEGHFGVVRDQEGDMVWWKGVESIK